MEAELSNPTFNNARGAAALSGTPPFDFDGVVMRVFPLKANMRILSRFCDQYLNLMPPEIALFRPALPYVFLSAINYGRMGAEGSNVGWVSQIEVVFSVPLHWCRKQDDGLVLERWAAVSPFIFVDEESSLATGREVYGWPKARAWLTPGVNEWAKSPSRAQRLFVLSSMVFPELFAGRRQEPRVLMEIEHAAPAALARLPLAPAGPLNPMKTLADAFTQSLSFAGGMVETLTRLPLQGYPTAEEQVGMPEMIGGAGDLMDVIRRLPVTRQVNLKQFRDSRDAATISYQAITSSAMQITRLNEAGLLGEANQLRGDPTGGHRIQIHRYSAQPIVESLGLEVAGESDGGDHKVATLEPWFPFWMDLDMNYGRGELVCWRAKQIGWRRGGVEDADETPGSEAVAHPYNTVHGAATQAVTGPFHFPNVTQRVLPLLADWFKLREFCAAYLDNDFTFFEPWGSYVYLIVTSFQEMSSETYNVGWWAQRQVTFSLPVKWYKRGAGGNNRRGKLIGTALVSPFAYTDSDLGATTGREVQGLPMVKARIASPRGAWLDDSGPARRSDMLRLSMKVFRAFGADQEMENRTLLEITPRPILPAHDQDGWKNIAAKWGERLYAEMFKSKLVRERLPSELASVRALAAELLRGDGQPINEISLRQFRDVEDPGRACYQGMTLTRTHIRDVFELDEMDQHMHVAIHDYPSQPIVETLGLRRKHTDASGSSVVHYLQPVRPFWARLAMRVDLGDDVFWRAASNDWTPNTEDWRLSLAELRKRGLDAGAVAEGRASPRNFYFVNQRPEVGRGLVSALDADAKKKRDLRVAWRFWRFPSTKKRAPTLLSRDEVLKALGESAEEGRALRAPPLGVEPQTVIESTLSNEWERHREPRSVKVPEIGIRSDTLPPGPVAEAFAERFDGEQAGRWFRPDWEPRLDKEPDE